MPQVTKSAQVDQLSIVVQMKANVAPSIQFLIVTLSVNDTGWTHPQPSQCLPQEGVALT